MIEDEKLKEMYNKLSDRDKSYVNLEINKLFMEWIRILECPQ